LDFFIAFSSLGTVYGNAGQSIYHAANMFMACLIEKRRRLGLAGSVLNLGMVVDVGYVARAQRAKGVVEEHLESNFYTPLAETEFHHAFVQAALASHPGSSTGDVTVGIQPYVDMPESILKPPWYSHPRFSHMIAQSSAQSPGQRTASNVDSRELFLRASSRSEAEQAFGKLFRKKIEMMIKISADRIDSSVPLADLGLDSLLAVEIRNWLLEYIGIDVSLLGILGHESISSIEPRVWDESTLLRHKKPAKEIPDSKISAKIETIVAADVHPSTQHIDVVIQGLPALNKDISRYQSESTDLQSILSDDESPHSADSTLSLENKSRLSEDTSQAPSISVVACKDSISDEHRNYMTSEKMSYAQASMFFMQSLACNPTMFNVTAQYIITGHLDVQRFRQALSQTVSSHDAYRTGFFVEPLRMQPLQALVRDAWSEDSEDFIITHDDNVDKTFQRFIDHEYLLSKGNVFQAVLIMHSAVSHTLLLGSHHIIMDGVSWHVFLRDLTRCYQMLPLSRQVHSSFDFARHQHAEIASGTFDDSVEYWLHELDPIPPVLPLLPLARGRREGFQPKYDIHTAQRSLSHDRTSRIVSTSREQGVTTMQFYLAVVASLFGRLLDLEEICIGVTDAGRGRFTEVIGHFTNLLPIRLRLDNQESFAGLLNRTSQTLRQGMRHARVPFELLLEKLGLHRSSRVAPLFQIAFNFRVGDLLSVKLGDCDMVLERYRDAKTPYDLVFNVTQTDSTHLIEVSSNSDVYSATSTEWILDAYLYMVRSLAMTATITIEDCQLYSRAQVDSALSLGQGPRVESKWPTTLIERFYQVCDKLPDAVAMNDSECFLTYGQLSRRVNSIAAAISRTEVRPGDHISVLCQPSSDTFAAMLAILHVGAIYVPIDISIPSARQKAMIAVCQPKLVICDAMTTDDAEKLCAAQYRMAQLNLYDVSSAEGERIPHFFRDEGFLLFTSGSTGTPKGVRLAQSGVMNYAATKAALLSLERVRVLQQSSLGFDMSLAQAFNAFANGGTLIIAPPSSRGDPARIAELMLRESVQFTICTPSEYATFTTYAAETLSKCRSWMYACSGGEALTNSLLSDIQHLGLSDLTVIDCYGPTELSCATTLKPIQLNSEQPFAAFARSVGPPIPNTSVYIGGPGGAPQPVGFAGEICVGGRGVALGYLGVDEDSTKFLHNPLGEYQDASSDFNVAYKTGDKGCLREDGSIILIGRIEGNTVIKLNGLRIDLDEVANLILAIAKGTVADAVVTVHGAPEFLVAHVVLAQRLDAESEILARILSELPLPRYMIPSLIVPLDRMPMTTNGKIDRKAVEAMDLPKQTTDYRQQTRLNVSEGELQLIWKEVLGESLGTASIEPETDFFTVGGSSLLLLRLQHVIKEKMGVTMELSDMYQSSSLRNMAIAAHTGRSLLVTEPIDWKSETTVTEELTSSLHRTEFLSPKLAQRVVVLTGACGFLGSHILQALIASPDVAKIHCVAVPADAQIDIPPSSKVVVYYGSIASSSFGLTSSELTTLTATMDQIIHAGAQGHCLNNYTSVRAANYVSTQNLARMAAPRRVPIHFISSPRVVLLSGSHSAPPESMSAHTPPTDGSEGFTASKWAGEVYLENAAMATGIPISIHRPCSLIGAAASHDDALNSVIRYSLLSHAVPIVPYAHGFFDFRSVDEVAVEIVRCDPARDGVAFHHHSSGVKVPFGELASRLEKLHGEEFAKLEIEEWIEKASNLGLDDLIVSYLRANVVGRRDLSFPYLGGLE
jgi:amino acid adenylation domain-containing protein